MHFALSAINFFCIVIQWQRFLIIYLYSNYCHTTKIVLLIYFKFVHCIQRESFVCCVYFKMHSTWCERSESSFAISAIEPNTYITLFSISTFLMLNSPSAWNNILENAKQLQLHLWWINTLMLPSYITLRRIFAVAFSHSTAPRCFRV